MNSTSDAFLAIFFIILLTGIASQIIFRITISENSERKYKQLDKTSNQIQGNNSDLQEKSGITSTGIDYSTEFRLISKVKKLEVKSAFMGDIGRAMKHAVRLSESYRTSISVYERTNGEWVLLQTIDYEGSSYENERYRENYLFDSTQGNSYGLERTINKPRRVNRSMEPLICPICDFPLESSKIDKSRLLLYCPNGHSFFNDDLENQL